MKYKELKEILSNFSEEQLDRDVLVWSMDETDFIDEVDFNYKFPSSYEFQSWFLVVRT